VHLVVYKSEAAAPGDFVTFWASQYDSKRYPEEPYSKNIGQLTHAAIMSLFEWKNGGKLSELKRESIKRNYLDRIGDVKALGTNFGAEDFLRKFLDGGAIWRIFWLHCCRPEFPIYDQHVHRAMTFIEEQKADELDQCSEDRKIELYVTRYLPFSGRFEGLNRREVDRALWAFGKFIKARHRCDVMTVLTTSRSSIIIDQVQR
jgi:hypothetical protein